MQRNVEIARSVVMVLVAAFLAGCATVAPTPSAQVSDPFEASNRQVFAVNDAVNQVALFPLVRAYRAVVPQPLQQGVVNGLVNLNEPTVFANNLLQGRGQAAFVTLQRFVVNSTIGIGGLFDVAAAGGLPRQSGDFGQTLYTWGAYESPFIVIPFLGPSTIRDGIGFGVDGALSPGLYGIYRANHIASYGVSGFDLARRLADLQLVDETAVDPYTRLRSVYYQTRRRELLEAIGRQDDVFDPTINNGAAQPISTAQPAARPRRR